MDSSKGKSFGIGGYRGRVIFLGDGTEVLTDTDDTEMFDQEDKDLDSQVAKSPPTTEKEGSTESSAAGDKASKETKAETTEKSAPKPTETKQQDQKAPAADSKPSEGKA
jgi:protein phosphatase 2C family protein 2/3